MTISRARGTYASLVKLGSFHDTVLSLTQLVACVTCSILLCGPVKPVLSCLAEPRLFPHEHVSASLVWPFWEPCPLARSCVLAGLKICPSQNT